jgi:hypothetical protein
VWHSEWSTGLESRWFTGGGGGGGGAGPKAQMAHEQISDEPMYVLMYICM